MGLVLNNITVSTRTLLVLFICTLSICTSTNSVLVLAYENVNGETLGRCSQDGMALTGFTRNGHCVNRNDDAGSHHICIDMSSNTGGNFCKVTGQPDWCSSSMQCNTGAQLCPVTNWCVCEWAFARYIHAAGGCDKIQNVVCDATNMQALLHYREKESRDPQIKYALECLESKCNINQQMLL